MRVGMMGAGVLAAILSVAACSTAPKPMPLAPVGNIAPEVMTAQALLNAYRRENGLGPLMIDPSLIGMAQGLADACLTVPKCDHNTGGSIPARLNAVGFGGVSSAAENLRRSEATLEGAFAWWKGSPVHKANMLLPDVTRMGFAKSSEQTVRAHWVLVVAADP